MHSWRVLILPFLEQQSLSDRYDFDEPWDSPKNRMVTDTMLNIFQCPSAQRTGPTETNYVMIVGPETVGFENSAVGIEDITDGMSSTIMVIETADSGIQWAEPRDLNLDELNLQINDGSGEGIRSRHSGGVNAAFCDGSVHFLYDSLDAETLRRLINRKDGKPVDYSGF
jgi:prepilin-type processing-associated H-X9-DG protein